MSKFNPFVLRPDQRAVAFEMTPERKERIKATVIAVVKIIEESSSDPMERLVTVEFVKRGFERSAGIKLEYGFPVKFDDLEKES